MVRARRGGHRGWSLRLPQRRPTDLTFLKIGVVVRSADGAKTQVQDVLFRLFRGRFRLKFGSTPWTLRVPRRDEAATVRADEQEADLSLLQDSVRISVPQ